MGPDESKPTLILLAGFGDGGAMFAPLQDTLLAEHCRLLPLDLPGFAGEPPLQGPTSLEALAEVVHKTAVRENAGVLVAHSVASIIASLAAGRQGSPVTTIVSLEGNLTAEDAYFSGTAADYDDAETFKTAFLARLDEMAETQPVVRRYAEMVRQADAQALWELGCDARRFSETHIPGEILHRAAEAIYLYNPDNCAPASLQWLDRSGMKAVILDGASHWPSVDQPELLAAKMLDVLACLDADSDTA